MHTRARILYVDDDQDLRLMMLLLLEQSGYGVLTASTVAEALELAKTIPFDLYILDLMLPDGSGFDLCQQLREIHPNARALYYTGYASAEGIRETLSKCGDDVLHKPVALEDLQEAIATTLMRKRSNQLRLVGELHRPMNLDNSETPSEGFPQ